MENLHRITLLGSIDKKLREWLNSHPLQHERGAIVLFKRFGRKVKGLPRSDRFVAVDVILMDGDWILESSETHFVINMRRLPELYLRCEKENLELGFVHNHPTGYDDFSPRDEINERNILHGLSGCNSPFSFLIALILIDGKWIGRIRQGTDPVIELPVRHITVLTNKIKVFGIGQSDDSVESLARQEAAFGKPFNEKLQSLRVAVIGLGGTGSPTATLLARCGIGELILIDGDALDISNLNRVRGYTSNDEGKNKAETLKKFIDGLGLNTTVTFYPSYLGDSGDAIDAISSADIVFGCTDDASGRDLVNQALYYYALVLIDVGLAGSVNTHTDGHPYLRDQRGRISCIFPESGACLRCQRVITEEMLRYEQAIKANPQLAELDSETLEKEFYIRGGGVRSPGVGPFTSSTADLGIATLMNLIRPYRDVPTDLREDNIWIDFIHLALYSNLPFEDSECIHCGNRYLLLKPEKKYRLDTPTLGEFKNEHYKLHDENKVRYVDKEESKIYFNSISYTERTPNNQDIKEGDFIVVKFKNKQYWALFKCPCGCGYVISLSLQKGQQNFWTIRKSKKERPTLYPSVWQNDGCLSHFWITDGRVFWCYNSGTKPRTYLGS
ncbi:MAG: thiamine biosynthesis protein ThiF [Bacteroidota bacterium]|jgi:molybdopterin/thiamine biosynthesis adenylyltransferase|nr:thiamine biosynthesis protein ThiF [Bacteroidota bacterium]